MNDELIMVESIEQLKMLCDHKVREGFIVLGNGLAKSSKDIKYTGKNFEILNHIDMTKQKLSEEQLFTDSNIGLAINRKAFFIYNE